MQPARIVTLLSDVSQITGSAEGKYFSQLADRPSARLARNDRIGAAQRLGTIPDLSLTLPCQKTLVGLIQTSFLDKQNSLRRNLLLRDNILKPELRVQTTHARVAVHEHSGRSPPAVAEDVTPVGRNDEQRRLFQDSG